MKPVRLIIVAGITGFVLLYFTVVGGAQTKNTKAKLRSTHVEPVSSKNRLLDMRKMLIERKKASKGHLEDLLAVYEKKFNSLSADHTAKRQMYQSDLISRSELEESERALTNAHLEVQQVRQWIAEDETALFLSELAAREQLERLPGLPLGGYYETATLIRYNGAADWSLADAVKIKKFFSKRFGRPLPVSAMGQSPTHDHMGFDHREAMDVAVRPDSEEGRGLIGYLRKARIPFIGFRDKVAGMATGAHIHIGRPSLRLVQIKLAPSNPDPPEKTANHG